MSEFKGADLEIVKGYTRSMDGISAIATWGRSNNDFACERLSCIVASAENELRILLKEILEEVDEGKHLIKNDDVVSVHIEQTFEEPIKMDKEVLSGKVTQ
jgi:hypothetical protein